VVVVRHAPVPQLLLLLGEGPEQTLGHDVLDADQPRVLLVRVEDELRLDRSADGWVGGGVENPQAAMRVTYALVDLVVDAGAVVVGLHLPLDVPRVEVERAQVQVDLPERCCTTRVEGSALAPQGSVVCVVWCRPCAVCAVCDEPGVSAEGGSAYLWIAGGWRRPRLP
jgi:hypothetical protein